MAVAAGVPVVAHLAESEQDVLGVNDRAQLAALKLRLADRAAPFFDTRLLVRDLERFERGHGVIVNDEDPLLGGEGFHGRSFLRVLRTAGGLRHL